MENGSRPDDRELGARGPLILAVSSTDGNEARQATNRSNHVSIRAESLSTDEDWRTGLTLSSLTGPDMTPFPRASPQSSGPVVLEMPQWEGLSVQGKY